MPEIASFRGVLLDRERLDPARVLWPRPGVAEATARAGADWLAAGVLVRDPYKAIYRYSQHFTAGGRALVRRGVVAAVRLMASGEARILSPERTRREQVEAQLALLDETRLAVAPPIALHADPSGEVERLLRPVDGKPPTIDVTLDGVRHVLHRVADAELYGKLRRVMVPRQLVLADGHHRLAAALALRDRLDVARAPAGLSPYASPQYLPMFLCAGADPGLVVRASHRVLAGVEGFAAAGFLQRAREYFLVDEVAGGGRDAAAVERALEDVPGHQPALVVAFPGEAGAWRLVLDAHVNPHALGAGATPMVARLPVSILHGLLFERVLGLAPAAHEGVGGHVRYAADAAAALAELPRAQAVFILPPPTADTLLNVTALGDAMPPRSAYPWPPLAPGIVSHLVDPDEDLA